MDGAYHGGLLYFGAGGGPLLAPFDFARVTYNDLDRATSIDEDVAAVLVEPMMGAAGCIPATRRVPVRRCERVATRRAHCWCSTR